MKQHILVIDDDASLRRIVEYNLSKAGYEPHVASSGQEGLAIVDQQRIDLVLTDMKMADMDGMAVLHALKQRFNAIPILIITAHGSIELAVQAIRSGAYDYITKPFQREELLLKVHNALEFYGLAEENKRLKTELSVQSDFGNMIATSPAMEKIVTIINKVADTDAAVLLTGESGTGKELVARAIHQHSGRSNAPFITINCAAIPRDLLESELFGHTKGAFTGAVRDKAGKFFLADTGTLFLDEVGELLPELQPKLLRVLQQKEVEPIGATKARKIDVRIISATNLDLEKAIAEGHFREDLYYRLAVIPLHLPPLRDRKEDIPLLVRFFARKMSPEPIEFTNEVIRAMSAYTWPGNIRELENTIERLLIMRTAPLISYEELPEALKKNDPHIQEAHIMLPPEGYSLEQLEREIIETALHQNGWNQAAAARFLRIPRHTLLYRMEKYGIKQEK